MGKRKDIIEGLQIFEKYLPDQWVPGAEHDVLWGCGEIADLSEEDRTRLEKLNWHFDTEYGCWAIFV